MWKIITGIAFIIGLGLLGFNFYPKEKLSGIIKEVSMYEATGEMEYFPTESSNGGAIGGKPVMKIRILKDGEFYKTGNTDAGSTTPEILYKPVGESLKLMLKSALLQ